MLVRLFLCLAALAALSSCAFAGPATNTAAPTLPNGTLGFVVREELPHDTSAFTQGLEIDANQLFESRGLYADQESVILTEIDLYDGTTIVRSVARPDGQNTFAEGITVVDDRIIQLTWQAGEAYVYNRESFELIDTITYEGEGWGICDQPNGGALVMSNGSADLTFRDPNTFAVQRTVTVTGSDGAPISQLNELECVDDLVLANVWNTNRILVIDPVSGAVESEIVVDQFADELGRWKADPRDGAVLNGIAYNPVTADLYITGKQWPVMLIGTLECVNDCDVSTRQHFQRLTAAVTRTPNRAE